MPANQDALTLLDLDHQRVETLFEDFKLASSDDRKADLAALICLELTLHAALEEELFYPALRQVSKDEEMVRDAIEEHQEMKDLIAELRSGGKPDALVPKLQEVVEHHVEEERNEVFPKARECGLDLQGLGEKLEQRKAKLVQQVQAHA